MLYASDLFRMNAKDQLQVEEMLDYLPDVVAQMLAQAVKERLQRNLHRTYEPQRGVLDRVRGGIDLLRTESRQLIRQGKVACRFEDLSIDTTRNRYVKAALESIASKVSASSLRHLCRTLARILKSIGVSDYVPSYREVSTDRFGPHDIEERFMVAVARLAFDLDLPVEIQGDRLLGRSDHDVRWLRKLFQRAVYGFYKVNLSPHGWSVHHGSRIYWPVDASTPGLSGILPIMETDIELIHLQSQRKIVIDTKFTSLIKPARFRETISSNYLYQIYSYLRSQVDESPLSRCAEGVLLHPTTELPVNEIASIQGHILRFTTVDLSGSPTAFKDGLLNIVNGKQTKLVQFKR